MMGYRTGKPLPSARGGLTASCPSSSPGLLFPSFSLEGAPRNHPFVQANVIPSGRPHFPGLLSLVGFQPGGIWDQIKGSVTSESEG